MVIIILTKFSLIVLDGWLQNISKRKLCSIDNFFLVLKGFQMYFHQLTYLFYFVGQMLISALLATIDEDHYIRLLVTNNDLKILLGHFFTFFLHMGVIRPVEEGNGCDSFLVITVQS